MHQQIEGDVELIGGPYDGLICDDLWAVNEDGKLVIIFPTSDYEVAEDGRAYFLSHRKEITPESVMGHLTQARQIGVIINILMGILLFIGVGMLVLNSSGQQRKPEQEQWQQSTADTTFDAKSPKH